MLRFFIMLLSLLLIGNRACADDALQNRLTDLLPNNARWALVVLDLRSGKEVTAVGNALQEPLIPGSLVKLFTAGAVLDHVVKKGILDMKTVILHDGTIKDGTLSGNLYLKGSGNALLSFEDIKKAANRLNHRGIGKITGDIIADDSRFDARGLARNRTGAGYAPAGALGLDLHTVSVTVTPSEPGKAPLVKGEPPNDSVRLAISARTTASAISTLKITQIADRSFQVTGNMPPDAAVSRQRFSLKEPALYAAGTLKDALQQAGVKVHGEAKKSNTPQDAKQLVEMDGPDLHKLLRDMNVNSLNVVADNLLLVLGAERSGAPGTREKGANAIRDFLDSLGLPDEGVTLADGSGLQDNNRVTARFTAQYLQRVSPKPWFASFRDSLPRVGMDGTVKEICYRNERFRVKTGRLENAYAMAGYGVDANSRDMAFAFIVNVPGAGFLHLEQCGAEVMRYLGPEGLQ